ncbi:MAG: DUF177 domain-containing protein [Caulobacterales bacterium]|nr:DUF177 domain-containing protein [Caulobacterales bacterium]
MVSDSPWRETIRFSEVSRGPVKRTLEADELARARIARLLGLVSIQSLTAELRLKPWMDGAEIDGRFTAEITQTCSVTAEDFEESAEGEFVIRVLPPGSINAPQEEADEIELDPEADDPPDVLEGEDIDLGAYVVEHLALELDPFPRKPGAEFIAPSDDTDLSPFAVLRTLKKDDPAD